MVRYPLMARPLLTVICPYPMHTLQVSAWPAWKSRSPPRPGQATPLPALTSARPSPPLRPSPLLQAAADERVAALQVRPASPSHSPCLGPVEASSRPYPGHIEAISRHRPGSISHHAPRPCRPKGTSPSRADRCESACAHGSHAMPHEPPINTSPIPPAPPTLAPNFDAHSPI